MVLFQQDRQPILAILRKTWFNTGGTGPTNSVFFGEYMMVPFEDALNKWGTLDWFTA